MQLAYSLGGVALVLATIGCGGPKSGTVVGNGAQVQMQLTGYDERITTQSLELTNGGTVDEMLLAVRRLRFTAGSSCDDADESDDIVGPLVADLVGDGLILGDGSIELAPGPFCRLRLEYHVAGQGEVPADLEGASILVKGRRADGVSYSVTSRLGDRFELETEGSPFELIAGTNPLFLGFGIGGPIEALELDSLGPGPIVIDEDQNSEALKAFEDAMKGAAGLFRDIDGNGVLSPDERDLDDELAD